MQTKEVRYYIYCPKCIHHEKNEYDDPCWECLNQGWNIDSHKPLYFEEEDKVETRAVNHRTTDGKTESHGNARS